MKSLFLIVVLSITTVSFSQQYKWVAYFPVSSDILADYVTGNRPMDFVFTPKTVDATKITTVGATTLTLEQRKSFALTITDIFSINKLRVADIRAYNVKIDKLDNNALRNMPSNVRFVYQGLRADSAIISFKKKSNQSLTTDSILSTLNTILPSLATPEVKAFENFLKGTVTSHDSTTYDITIKDPSVYFMIQVSELKRNNKSFWCKKGWDTYCASFYTLTGQFPRQLILGTALDGGEKRTRSANTWFCKTNQGTKADTWLQIDSEKNLWFYYRTSPAAKVDSVMLTEDQGEWTYVDEFIFRYPFNSGSTSIYYKEVLLNLRAHREGNKIVVDAKDDSLGSCGRSYIKYPEAELIQMAYKLR